MTFIKVDLPDPDEPMMAMNSPRATVRLTPCSAWTTLSPSWNDRVRSVMLTTAPVMPRPLDAQRRRGRRLGRARSSRDRRGDDDLVSQLEVARLDLGEGLVVEPDGDGHAHQLAVALHPDRATGAPAGCGLAAPCGEKRSAAEGTLSTFRTCDFTMAAVAVIPGRSRS